MARREEGEPYYRISVDEAAELYGTEGVVFVDVRRPEEYSEGHVKDATFMPVDDVGSRVDELPKDKKLLFICAQGFRSGLACEMAAAMGIDSENLYNVEDGTPTWVEKGNPTSYGSDA